MTAHRFGSGFGALEWMTDLAVSDWGK